MTISTVPIKSFLVSHEGERVGQFVGLDLRGEGFALHDAGNILQITFEGGGGGGSSEGPTGTVQTSDGSGGFLAANNILATDDTFTFDNGVLQGASLTFDASSLRLFGPTEINGDLVVAGSINANGAFQSLTTAGLLTLEGATSTFSGSTQATVSSSLGDVEISSGALTLLTANTWTANVATDTTFNSNNIALNASAALFLQIASATLLSLNALQIETSVPLAGRSASARALTLKKFSYAQTNTADKVLATNEYDSVIIEATGTPGGNFNILAPVFNGAPFFVFNRTANVLTFRVSGQPGVSIAANRAAIVVGSTTDYIRLTADA